MSTALFAIYVQQNIVHLSKGKLITNSLTIAWEIGRRHDNVMRSLANLIKNGKISFLEFKKQNYTDEHSKPHRTIELSERGVLIAMPFTGEKNHDKGKCD